MSWHCLFCGGPDQWVRGKERPLEKDFVELAYYDPFGKKGKRKRLNSWCAHASCLRLVLKAGQNRYLEDGELYDFETRFYPAMYTVDQRKAMGDYSAFITWRNELNELFFRLRQMGHSVGFDSRAGYNTKDLRKSIKEKLAEPRLNLD